MDAVSRYTLLGCLLLLASPSALAQPGPSFPLADLVEITGQVSFAGGGTPQGAMVSLQSPIGEIDVQQWVSGNGRFRFGGLKRTLYQVVVKANGYRPDTQWADLRHLPRTTLMFILQPLKSEPAPRAVGAGPIAVQSLGVPVAARDEFERAKKLLDKGKFDKALEHFRKAIDIYPAYLEAHHMVGVVLMDQRKWTEAEQTLKHCLEINDKFAPSYIALGTIYNLAGQPGKAGPLLQRGLELDPNSWQGHSELARSLLAQGKVADAETHARRAHELKADYPLVHVVLGNIALHKRDLQTARQEYQHYLDLAPAGPLAPIVKDKTEQIDSALGKQAAKQPKL